LDAFYIKQEKKRCEQGHHFNVFIVSFCFLFYHEEKVSLLGKGTSNKKNSAWSYSAQLDDGWYKWIKKKRREKGSNPSQEKTREI